MGTTLTVRLPDELADEIERISREEQLDTRAVVRKLLDRAVTDRRREQAFQRYERGEISLETLADRAEFSFRQVLPELRERGIHFQYSQESLREDLPEG